MRHSKIYKKAQFIDQFIRYYRTARKRKSFPHKAAGQLIILLFSNSIPIGHGAFKKAFYVQSRKRDLVLKISESKNLKNDFETYNRIPETIRNRYFAKLYWATDHCMLQKWAKKAKISKKDQRLLELKKKLTRYGLTDIRPAIVKH